ncbi:P-loop containing nucleoside triphosphate hydrolase protein, partial [Blyttiomyces helicus]
SRLFAEYGIPPQVAEEYIANNIKWLYEWQARCLKSKGVLEGTRNLLYSAPTSAGKTMVAELLMLLKVIKTSKKAIMILPFISIVSEKTKYLQKMFASENLNIVGYYANNGAASFDDIDVAICTIEKANTLVNTLITEQKLDQVAIVVVDELHMVGDSHRGYILEVLMNKIRLPTIQNEIQIVGMSATLQNIGVLASWLDAELFISDYRPVPLVEYYKVGNQVKDVNGNVLRTLQNLHPSHKEKDKDFFVSLVAEVLRDGKSTLVFCSTKKACETSASLLSKLLDEYADEEIIAGRQEIIRELSRTPGGLDPRLEAAVLRGVAFHHAGLTTDEREIIEDGYKNGLITVLTATATLSSGVNLPARRVIFREPKIGRNFIKPQEYRQMKGRAGRKGKDTLGESVLMCREEEEPRVRALFKADLPVVESCLRPSSPGMHRAILEIIAAGAAATKHDIERYGECTMLFAEHQAASGTEKAREIVRKATHNAVDWLAANQFIAIGDDESVRPTLLGSATMSSALAPEEALVVYASLDKASHNFNMNNELHIVFQVTPTYMTNQINIDWSHFYRMWELLAPDNRDIGKRVGVTDYFLLRAATGQPISVGDEHEKDHKRFYTALILYDLVREVSFEKLIQRYNVDRGMLQTLQTAAATFSGMVKIFCEKLRWSGMEMLVAQFQDRL